MSPPPARSRSHADGHPEAFEHAWTHATKHDDSRHARQPAGIRSSPSRVLSGDQGRAGDRGGAVPGFTSRPLDRGGAVPIFEQIMERLREAIAEGPLGADQRLPSEVSLAEQFGVSRMTVRKAVDKLVSEGVLYRRPAHGTFVTDRYLEQPLSRLSGFTQDVTARGMRPSSVVLAMDTTDATFEMAQLCGLPPGARVVRIVRLRLGDGEPLAIERVFLPAAYVPAIEEHDFSRESLYQVLREEYDIVVASAHQTMEAALPTAEEQEGLGIGKTAPVLRIFRLTSDVDGRVVEYVRSAYRGDRFQLSVALG
jgi:GntR family transcriptional regulator